MRSVTQRPAKHSNWLESAINSMLISLITSPPAAPTVSVTLTVFSLTIVRTNRGSVACSVPPRPWSLGLNSHYCIIDGHTGNIRSCAGPERLNCHFPLWETAPWARGLQTLGPFAPSQYPVAGVWFLKSSGDFVAHIGNICGDGLTLAYFWAWARLQNRLCNQEFLEIKSGLISHREPTQTKLRRSEGCGKSSSTGADKAPQLRWIGIWQNVYLRCKYARQQCGWNKGGRNRSQRLTACHNRTRSFKKTGEIPRTLAERNRTMRTKQAASFVFDSHVHPRGFTGSP